MLTFHIFFTLERSRSACRLHLVDNSMFHCENGDVTPATTVRNLGAFFDAACTIVPHADRLARAWFYQLRRLRAIRRSITITTAIQLVNRFVVTCVDNCNSLLAGLPAHQFDRIQSVLNYAARLVYGRRKYDHVTPLLRDNLHWLRDPGRVKFKCCLLVFKALNGLAPTYIADVCVKVPASERRSTLHSAGIYQYNLVIPRRANKFSERSFSVSGPAEWNSLPDYM